MGTNINLNTKSFAFLESSHFKTIQWCKAHVTALVLLEQTFNSLSCIPSLVNATPRYLNFSTCFNDTPPTCIEHWKEFVDRWSISVLKKLIFIPAMSQAAAQPLNICWRPDLKKPAKLNHVRKATD